MTDETNVKAASDLNSNLTEIKEEMKKDNRKDAFKDNVRNAALIVMAICAIIVTVYVVMLIKNINDKINAIYVKADAAVTTLNEVANDVSEADLPGMAQQLKSLTEDATDAVATAMDKIDSIDIDSLNDTIHQLDETTQAFASTVNAIGSIFG